jgi:hypothetical protein
MSQERRVRRRGRRRQSHRNTRGQQPSQQGREYTLSEVVNGLIESSTRGFKNFQNYLNRLINKYNENSELFFEDFGSLEEEYSNQLKAIVNFLLCPDIELEVIEGGHRNSIFLLNSDQKDFLKSIVEQLSNQITKLEEIFKDQGLLVFKEGFLLEKDFSFLSLCLKQDRMDDFCNFFKESAKERIQAVLEYKYEKDEKIINNNLVHLIALFKRPKAFLSVVVWAKMNHFDLAALLNTKIITYISEKPTETYPLVRLNYQEDHSIHFDPTMLALFINNGARLDVTYQKIEGDETITMPIIYQIIDLCMAANDFRVYEHLRDNYPEVISEQMSNFPTVPFPIELGFARSSGHFLHYLCEGQGKLSKEAQVAVQYFIENEPLMLLEKGSARDCTPVFYLLKRKMWNLVNLCFENENLKIEEHFIDCQGQTPLLFWALNKEGDLKEEELEYLIDIYESCHPSRRLWEIRDLRGHTMFFFYMGVGNRKTFDCLVQVIQSWAEENELPFELEDYLSTEEGVTPFHLAFDDSYNRRRHHCLEGESSLIDATEISEFLKLVSEYPEYFSSNQNALAYVLHSLIIKGEKRALIQLRELEKDCPQLDINWHVVNKVGVLPLANNEVSISPFLSPLMHALLVENNAIFSFLLKVLYEKEQIVFVFADDMLNSLKIYNPSTDICEIIECSKAFKFSKEFLRRVEGNAFNHEQLENTHLLETLPPLTDSDFKEITKAIFHGKTREELEAKEQRKRKVQSNLAEERRRKRGEAERIREQNRRNRQLEREERQKEEPTPTIEPTLFFAEESSEEALLPESLFISDLDLEIPVVEGAFKKVLSTENCLLYIDREALVEEYGEEEANSIIKAFDKPLMLSNNIRPLRSFDGRLKINEESEIDVSVNWKFDIDREQRFALYNLQAKDSEGNSYWLLVTGQYVDVHQRKGSKTFHFNWGGVVENDFYENFEDSSYELT